MKNKLFLTMLCTIGLCLIFACSMDVDTTASIPRNVGTPVESKKEYKDQIYEKLLLELLPVLQKGGEADLEKA